MYEVNKCPNDKVQIAGSLSFPILKCTVMQVVDTRAYFVRSGSFAKQTSNKQRNTNARNKLITQIIGVRQPT